ncbi:unnamed protein product, partial [Rotaria sp. Silwood1]
VFIDCERLSFVDGVCGALGNVYDNGHEPVKGPRENFRIPYFKPKDIKFFLE